MKKLYMGDDVDNALRASDTLRNFGEVLDSIPFAVNFSSLLLMKNNAVISGFQI